MRQIVYHILAKEFGWSRREVDAMLMSEIVMELELIKEDAVHDKNQVQR